MKHKIYDNNEWKNVKGTIHTKSIVFIIKENIKTNNHSILCINMKLIFLNTLVVICWITRVSNLTPHFMFHWVYYWLLSFHTEITQIHSHRSKIIVFPRHLPSSWRLKNCYNITNTLNRRKGMGKTKKVQFLKEIFISNCR